ncbi:DNA replication/repair protein RecF [Myxococcus llanfairpwllgwyngyllgogerychwyrndrobwllllantysiliogogogochensis]|uniref:DNA replication and repair protein RecF n=1 Tax=Myxococcus llanfairpwllgwyngyllgogerychwyrndrobwllllantysiliogogogochensis TaxID=2590453 RepID=A0A540X4Y7_9BACT|nr:DNA replication/repair protein RecF [Myxococcus llanfairpwllgwyngyllgogerychwyrndrobwllllantysiliogogogochensis]NTX53187.1 DNA replication/repair protein RecF [Myxococcus sp. CA039A]TQF16279.1 DNA replication/repair protein RecF [Myxococcus llanfairpwllgwyngyllgogerychwyrndrobwllllantysiliogogogochensis]
MRLLALHVQDFRNLAQVTLTPSAHATIAVGQNGQGKTNLLEGLYFLATLKPLRAGRLSELVRWGTQTARVSGRFLLKGAEREIAVEVGGGTRQAFVDGKKAASLEEYFGGVSVVAFTPDDLEVVKGGPDSRRGFLDRAVFNRFPAYLRESREYARALKNRNRLLREGGAVDPAYLDAYDETLAKAGARIYARRRALMAELSPRAQATFASIGRTVEPASYGYHPAHLGGDFATADEAALALALRESLGERLRRDLDRGFTSVGPHSDDVTVTLGGRSARAYASQGQQRALVLGWKIAEIENLETSMGFLPLLMLDDVSSELDPERNAYLMDYLARSGAQVFLSTTDGSLVRGAAAADTLWLSVHAGQVTTRDAETPPVAS